MTNETRRIVLLGPPASGKGTQAQKIAQMIDATVIATGTLLRDAIGSGTLIGAQAARYMNAGVLVPDQIIIGLVRYAVSALADARAVVFDGFPRTLVQADALDVFCPPTLVVLLVLDDAEVVRRISGRRIGPAGEPYHVLFNPPLPGVEVQQRPDDREEVVRARLEVYHKETAPLEARYERARTLRRVDASGTIEEVFERILAVLQ